MRFTFRRRLGATALVLSMAMIAAACGDDDDSATTDTTAPTATEAPSEGDGAASEGSTSLEDLVAAAEEEGSVTIYSSTGLDQLNDVAEAFEEKYPGIDVEVVRGNDADNIPRVETEMATGTSGADLLITSNEIWVREHAEAGDFQDPSASPQIAGEGDYDAELYVHEGNYFEIGAAILTFAWNTDDVPDGVTDYADLLDPKFGGGRLAVIDPAVSPSVVDFYLWLEEEFGETYVEDLAKQKPRIYPSALPIGEALTSGEVSASVYAAPVQLRPAQENGAPVDFGLSESGAWGARFYGMIPKSSDSPNAAALLADFILTAEGQDLIQPSAGTVIDTPNSLITNDKVRKQDLEAIAPEPAAAFVDEWNGLFR